MKLASVAVYCGSSPGSDPKFVQAAACVGRTLAAQKLRLVYGGGWVGMMGVVADATLSAGGEVTGVIPTFLDTRELKHPGVTDMRVVSSMHERKLIMVNESDAFIALPGGFGTLDEVFEVLTWSQLNLHAKPVALLNVGGFFDGLLTCLDGMVTQGFLRQQDRDRLIAADTVEAALTGLRSWVPPADTKFVLARRAQI